MSKRSNSTLQDSAHTTSPLWSLPTPDLIDALPAIFANGENWPMLCSLAMVSREWNARVTEARMALKSIVFDGAQVGEKGALFPHRSRWARCLQSVAVLCPRLQRLEIRDCKIVPSNYLLEVLCKAAENDLLQNLSVIKLEGCERKATASMCIDALIQLPSLERVECDHAIFPAPAIPAAEAAAADAKAKQNWLVVLLEGQNLQPNQDLHVLLEQGSEEED